MPSTSSKDTIEAEFIKHLNDKTVVFKVCQSADCNVQR